MKNYSAAAVITLASGRVKLTPEQYKTRAHNLMPVNAAAGVYEIVKPVQFKRGESFGYDGILTKAMAGELMTPEQIRAEADAKAKEEKKAKAKAAAESETKKKAEEKAANEKAETMAQAVAEADKVVASARKALADLGVKADPAVMQVIEQTIEDMGIFADDGDVEGLKVATAALVSHTGNLIKKK